MPAGDLEQVPGTGKPLLDQLMQVLGLSSGVEQPVIEDVVHARDAR